MSRRHYRKPKKGRPELLETEPPAKAEPEPEYIAEGEKVTVGDPIHRYGGYNQIPWTIRHYEVTIWPKEGSK